MYLKKMLRLSQTLAFRLTLWYAGIFAISSFAAFLAFYLLANSVIERRTDHELLNEISEYSSVLSLKGIETLKSALIIEAESEGVDRIFFRVVTRDGVELFSSNLSSWGNLSTSRTAAERLRERGNHIFETITLPDRRYKVRTIYAAIGPGEIMQIGESLEENELLLQVFREIFGATMVVLTALGALIGWFMARRALVGIEEVTRTAMDISRGAFGRRVAVKTRANEINRLATAFNVMLDRIDALVTGMREMADNMAHDLRNPITRIRGIAEITLATHRSTEEYEDMATNTIEECNRLLEMADTILDISEAEAGASQLRMENIEMAKVVRDTCELFQPTAEGQGITLISKIFDSSFVYGDTQRLQRMLVNLLDNALKYTPSGGTVTVAVNRNEGKVVISVKDTGIGISRDDLPHIFERFYRCDQSRSHSGVGLGLSLSMAIARAHGGNIAATSRPGKGSKFTVILPQTSHSR